MRVALYWAPEAGDALLAAGNGWLGRDPETGVALAPPDVPGIAAATRAPRAYGFHATLRPPLRLATGWAAFMDDAYAIAKSTAPFGLPPLAAVDMEGFLALRETAPCLALHALADACVRDTDRHRAPPSQAELSRRRAGRVSAEREALLMRWGYPDVMAQWRFHMTLSERLDAAGMAHFRPAAEAHFAAALAGSRAVVSLAVFTQGEDDAPFRLAERLRLSG